ncbi:Lsr2 family DNA-binding protein [Streptomyces werraensis]|uniref:Lsr2 family DNA-binding protein n=1 Tax=Streptomyces werraensis TaxID=68284 RepID=UPI0038000213
MAPTSGLTEAAAARTVARNARDRGDLVSLLSHLGLPYGEDDIADLVPLLNVLTDRQSAGDCMSESTPTSNAYRTAASSALTAGTDASTVREELALGEDELTEALRHAASPAVDARHTPETAGTTAATDNLPIASTATGQEAAPAAVDNHPVSPYADCGHAGLATGDVAELLAWAELHDTTSQQIAAEVRSALAGLAQRRENSVIIQQLRDKVTALEDELAHARQELRTAMNNTHITHCASALDGAPTSQPREGTTLSADRRAIRRWAKAQGLPVADRGALPKHIITAFQAAQDDTASEDAS